MDNFGHLGKDDKILLKCIFKKWRSTMLTAFKWLKSGDQQTVF